MTLATQESISFNDRDEHTTVDIGPAPQPIQTPAGLPLHARFLEEEIQFRTSTVPPDMRIMKSRATAWLRRQPDYIDAPGFWVEATACGLVSFTRSFFAAYQGFRNAPKAA
ncbi:hypothetical protein [Paraburkholderia tropica]|uniref:hypothetical protein n=1 Tax=Paraburkholderia tropica TaxID=92647 RepID=UPI0007ED07AE|nr:hypothetical protein [Paraburkholderia tropica]OBR53718.1 hypothetical protein A6456_12355 [Paraburkholderia tropica]